VADAGSAAAATGTKRDAADAGSQGSDSAMITDEQCLARGGQLVAVPKHASPRGRPGLDDEGGGDAQTICRYPSPKNGAKCRGDGDCAGGFCLCTGALDRPNPQDDPKLKALDGTPATGACSDGRLPKGKWFCVVKDGKVELHGIIID
jgi:hypothetical protein